jgi:hypothetical protein
VTEAIATAPSEPKAFVQNPSADWRSMLRDAQSAQMHLSPEGKIEADKASATVRIFEKMNLSDRRPWGTFNPGGATALCHSLPPSDAAAVLQARVNKWKGEYGEDKLLYHRIWQGQCPVAPNSPQMRLDGWIYLEAYFLVPDCNVTYRAVLTPDGSILAY